MNEKLLSYTGTSMVHSPRHASAERPAPPTAVSAHHPRQRHTKRAAWREDNDDKGVPPG